MADPIVCAADGGEGNLGADLYAGPLQRYYTRRWETPAETFARSVGATFSRTHTKGYDPLSLPDGVAIEKVEEFAARLAPKLRLAPARWHESFDTPCKVVQITRQAVGALELWAAYQHRTDLTRPLKLPDDPWADVAVAEASERGYYLGAMSVIDSHMIVPGEEARIAAEIDPIGRQLFISTSAALDDTVEQLAPGLDLLTEGAVGEVLKNLPSITGKLMVKRQWFEVHKPEWYEIDVSRPDDEVKEFARYGLACIMSMHAFAKENKVPILLDD